MRAQATVCLPASGHYGREEFLSGLDRAGFAAAPYWPGETRRLEPQPGAGDVLVVWNRQNRFDAMARRFEAAGNTVIVAENGYIGDDRKGELYALAKGNHNGAGKWRIGETERWSSFGVELQPWRTDGSHILVLPQRSIGPDGVAMPLGWTNGVVRRLKAITGRPIRVRPHPGKRPHPPLDPDLQDAWCAVTWGSGAAIKALVAGIPVFYELAKWIGAPAAVHGIADIEAVKMGPREPMLHCLSWAQWRRAEVESGEAFEWLLAA